MNVVILAAGRGSRLGALGEGRPKCLLPFAGDTLLGWQLRALHAAGISEVHIVRGYCGAMLDGVPATFSENPEWAVTNMVHSLFCAKPVLEADSPLLISYGDIVYEAGIVDALRGARGDIVVAVNRQWLSLWQQRMEDPLKDAETLRISEDGRIVDIGRRPNSFSEIDAQYMGLIRLTEAGLKQVSAFFAASDETASWMLGRNKRNCYMTDLLRGLIEAGLPVTACPVDGGWLEFDTGSDLELYERLVRQDRISQFFNPAARKSGYAGR